MPRTLPPADNSAPTATDAARRPLGIRDIARLAGVSPMSVSRALKAPEKVAEKTLSKIQAAIAQTGFIANKFASDLSSSTSGLIAVIVPAIAGPVFQNIIQAISAAFAARGYHVMLGQAGYGIQQEDRLLDAILRKRPDGIVLVGVVPSASGRRKLEGTRVPTVETWDLVEDPIDMAVGFSHELIGAAAVEHLVAAGCRSLAFVGGSHARARRRGRAFMSAIEAHPGVAASLHEVLAPTNVQAGRDAFRIIRDQSPATDGIFCSSDLLAYGVIIEAEVLGLSVPGHLRVMGLGDMPFAADVSPAITTFEINSAEIAELAANYLVSRASGIGSPKVIDVGFRLIARDST